MTPELRQDRADKDLRELMRTPAGRRHLWAHIEPVFGPSFAGEDSRRTAFNEGRRASAVELLAHCQRVDWKGLLKLLGEGFREAERDREEAERAVKDLAAQRENGG